MKIYLVVVESVVMRGGCDKWIAAAYYNQRKAQSYAETLDGYVDVLTIEDANNYYPLEPKATAQSE